MRTIQKHTTFIFLFLLVLYLPLYSFDWPQNLAVPKPFASFFAQNRGNTLSPSLSFIGSTPIKASDAGKILLRMEQNQNFCSFFPSTLGNAVIIAHKDHLLTVYASLEEVTISPEQEELTAGQEIGLSGNSGWHSGSGCLEFQVIDTKNRTVINPLVLMPSFTDAFDLQIGSIFLTDKRGVVSELKNRRSIESGSYTVHRDASAGIMPYKTAVTINGVLVQSITYDALFLYEQELCIKGKDVLPYSSIYSDNSLQLLADIHMNRGRTVITIQIFDILGNQKQISYTLDVQ